MTIIDPVHAPSAAPPPHDALANLRGVILLAGAIRPGPLRRATGRTLLQLPLDASRTVLDHWRHLLVDLAGDLEFSPLPVRIMMDHAAGITPTIARHGPVDISIEPDISPYRGVGGLLADVARDYHEDDYLLVAHASRLPWLPLTRAAGALSQVGADAAILCRGDGEPAGLMLVRCGALASISRLGFVDFNEQALPAISREHDVRVVRVPGAASRPIRTLRTYLAAVGEYHRSRRWRGQSPHFHAGRRDGFAVIEPGASVHPDAVIRDSVVLAGGQVEAGATLLRSVVCARATAPAGVCKVDELLVAPPTRRWRSDKRNV